MLLAEHNTTLAEPATHLLHERHLYQSSFCQNDLQKDCPYPCLFDFIVRNGCCPTPILAGSMGRHLLPHFIFLWEATCYHNLFSFLNLLGVCFVAKDTHPTVLHMLMCLYLKCQRPSEACRDVHASVS